MFIPGFLISIATFPGVIVHELAHVAFCKFTDTRVLKVCYFRVGNPAGYVIHEQPGTVWRHILIGVGPFFVNTFLGFMLGIIAIPMHMDLDHPTPPQLLLLWLGVSIAMHSFPSTGDARSIWQAVWSKGAPISARLIGSPLVIVIFAGAIGLIFWLDALYGIGVVGAAGALQKASQRDFAATPGSDTSKSVSRSDFDPATAVPIEDTPAYSPHATKSLSAAATRVVSSPSYEQIIKDVSRDMNATLPMQVDKDTRLDTTLPGPGRRLTYVYTYTGDAEVDQETITTALRPSIINGYKTSPGMAGLRDHDVELHYSYRDKLGKFLGEITVSPKDF